MNFVKLSKDDILVARQVNLSAYLQSKGVKLKREGGRYKHSEHDSLVFTDNMYYWNSLGESGNTLTYVNKYMNLSFPYAVKDLCEFAGKLISLDVVNKEEFSLDLINDLRRSISYLQETRKINKDVIQFLIDLKLLSQTKQNNNIAFLIKDENFETVGAELNTSLSEKRFKGLSKNSKYGYGFNLCNTKNPKNGIFFESAIDLASFIQYIGLHKFLEKVESSIFVSMAGLKENVIRKMKEIYGFENIILAVDNPEYEKVLPNGSKPAQNFIDLVKTKYSSVDVFLPKGFKDWNDLIKYKK